MSIALLLLFSISVRGKSKLNSIFVMELLVTFNVTTSNKELFDK